MHPNDLHGSIWPQPKEVPITTFVTHGRTKKKFDVDGTLLTSNAQYDFNGNKIVQSPKQMRGSCEFSSDGEGSQKVPDSPLRN